MLDLSNPLDRKQLAEQIKSDIDGYCEHTYRDDFRTHLGASSMGEMCSRKLFYMFRWIKAESYSGRMRRLFQVGHNAEPRFIQYLKGIGFEVWEKDEITGKQFTISECNGHYGGSLDGMCRAPARYGITEELIFLNEFKTNGTGAGFTNVEAKGIAREKPKHFAQMSQYGLYYQLKYGLYLIENKNDSDIIVQIVELDWNLGKQLTHKASEIINAIAPPNKISENPSYSECKYCNFAGPCHNKEAIEKNCRSCRNAKPIENKQWLCQQYGQVIPESFIKQGCDSHVSINS